MTTHIMRCGDVTIHFLDGQIAAYEGVTNVSISDKWVFIKFDDRSRVQIPTEGITRMYEDADVFVKWVTGGGKPDDN